MGNPKLKASISIKVTGFLLAISVLPLLAYQVVSYGTTRQTVIDLAARHSMQLLSNQLHKIYLLRITAFLMSRSCTNCRNTY